MACCDQFAARRLLRSGVVSSEFEKEHAALTEFGRELISEKKSAGKESR
jgi:triphosphoribosyl-dephospho-CoA synthetase